MHIIIVVVLAVISRHLLAPSVLLVSLYARVGDKVNTLVDN